jgi:O-acetyl-ADP-ribose deacetylase
VTRRKLDGAIIECVLGDITRQPDIDAVVNAANSQLKTGGGVAGAIHAAAGPGLVRECESLAPIRPGQAVITGAHGLPNRRIIHCLGPVYGFDEPAHELLASCYVNALKLAEEHGLRSIAFPAISTGAFDYPMEDAAKIALRAVLDTLPRLSSVEHLRFVLHDSEALRIHEQTLETLAVGLFDVR